jgi:hypothetical protein
LDETPGRLARFVAAPILVYFAVFSVLTYPLILSFSTRFFTNAGDGLQNVWNLWWVDRAVTVLHTTPWFTTYLHYPYGVSLVGHTLNPFNGLLAIPLLRLMTLVQVHNTIVLLGFVMGGVTAFWLAYRFCGRFWPSILGGGVFTFSEYHFAHAEGHLQLVSLEWLPVFALTWHMLLNKPTPLASVGTAVALLLVILCDYYYFAYSLLYAGIATGWEVLRRRDAAFLVRKPYAGPIVLFFVLTAATSGILIQQLLTLNAVDPLLGSHQADEFSTDLLAAVIPGGHWRFAEVSMPFWGALPGNIHESSVDVGISVLVLLALLIGRRSSFLVRQVSVWGAVLLVFWMLSLGPVLRISGTPAPEIPMPYRVLQKLIPALSLGGVPARMMVMVYLAAGVLASVSLTLLWRESLVARAVACALVALMAVEYLPQSVSATSPDVPGYVLAVRNISGPGGLLDMVSGYSEDHPFGDSTGAGVALYYQTIHERPIASGYIARLPQSAWDRLLDIKRLVDQNAYAQLCRDYDLRYVLMPASVAPMPSLSSARLLYSDPVGAADLFDVAPDGVCIAT